jgi:hypothetical protein
VRRSRDRDRAGPDGRSVVVGATILCRSGLNRTVHRSIGGSLCRPIGCAIRRSGDRHGDAPGRDTSVIGSRIAIARRVPHRWHPGDHRRRADPEAAGDGPGQG